ncbi:hypothetical protein BCD67_03050 [Oscillatoriales cyanobacterium USR001]|nr:hypothetical protein BCD67_03050 [Oscillatoriales cyanobacterium USR001]
MANNQQQTVIVNDNILKAETAAGRAEDLLGGDGDCCLGSPIFLALWGPKAASSQAEKPGELDRCRLYN